MTHAAGLAAPYYVSRFAVDLIVLCTASIPLSTSIWRLAMAAAIGVRTEQTSKNLRRFARRCGDPDLVRRLLAIALPRQPVMAHHVHRHATMSAWVMIIAPCIRLVWY